MAEVVPWFDPAIATLTDLSNDQAVARRGKKHR